MLMEDDNLSQHSVNQQQNVQVQAKQMSKASGSKSHNPLIWAIVGGVVGAILAVGITLGVLAATGVFNNDHTNDHDASNSYHYDDGGRYIEIKKPLIYLYPEAETEVTVKLGTPEKLTSTYPKYTDGWEVIASPNGDLIDKKSGDRLYALYWEGKRDTEDLSFDTGFVVKGTDSADFLREKLEILGLNYKEKEEFIVYWLPKLEANKYNYIYFATAEEIAKDMPLELSVEPDTMIRVSMIFEGLDDYVELPEQVLTPAPERKGFTVVEWGGTEL